MPSVPQVGVGYAQTAAGMGKSERPEHTAPPEIFYNEDEARKYTSNSRMIEIQSRLTQRAVELLALPDDGTPRMLLDIGCGSGLSGEALTETGHMWVGMDISQVSCSCRGSRRPGPASLCMLPLMCPGMQRESSQLSI